MTTLFNGNRAAVSLTFDDAMPCQLKYAIPEMDAAEIKGTIFAITDSAEYPLDVPGWRKPAATGHEIGSHTVTHRKVAVLGDVEQKAEARDSKRILENHFGTPVTSFCYPYTDAPQGYQNCVRSAGYKQARGGRVARPDKYIVPGDGANAMNLPCFHVNGGLFDHGDIFAYIYAALERGAWLTLMFHSIGPAYPGAWDLVAEEKFRVLCQFLKAQKERGLWTAPFGTVAENMRQAGGLRA